MYQALPQVAGGGEVIKSTAKTEAYFFMALKISQDGANPPTIICSAGTQAEPYGTKTHGVAMNIGCGDPP